MEFSGQVHSMAHIPWVELKVGVDAVEKRKMLLLPGIEPGPSVLLLARHTRTSRSCAEGQS
jgi:hypothetical protein